MQYQQQVPNILLSGDNTLFEAFARVYRLELIISAVVRRLAPLLMVLGLALHYVAWQFMAALRVEYGHAVIGLGLLALAIFSVAYLGRRAPARRWLDLGLRLLYALVACGLLLEYSEVVYLPAIDYLQHLHVRRHLFAPLSVSVMIGALGLLITALFWGESKVRVYALGLALAACWISYAGNVSGSLVLNTRPDINAQAEAPPPVPSERRKNADSVLNSSDIRALSRFDSPASLNNQVRSRIKAEQNLCLTAALAAFGFCMVCVWALRTWLQGHGIHSRREVVEVLKFLQERPRPNA